MQVLLKFRTWLAKRKDKAQETKRIRKLAEDILKWNAAVEAGKISRKGHRKS